jgi:D-alanyl-D-alanine dipeptidase
MAGNRIEIVAASFFAASAAFAQTTEPLFSSSEDTLGNAVTYPDGTPAELTGSLVTMMPGDSTGWHLHPVPTVGYVLSGRLTVEYATGETRRFDTGEGFIEGQNIAHNGHNFGDQPLRIVAFQTSAPGLPATQTADPPRPDDFVDLQRIVHGLQIEMRYVGNDNFVGRPITGYEANIVYLTLEAATALGEVQSMLGTEGLGLKVFDGYRPQRAVDDFMQWASDPDDRAMKDTYYPAVDKSMLIPNGYIAERSGHSRGSTVDLTLVDLESGEALDMGSPYDYFDTTSWPSSTSVSETARDNRIRLREVMVKHGFEPLEEEWWHFTLRNEPYPDRYFDFPVR